MRIGNIVQVRQHCEQSPDMFLYSVTRLKPLHFEDHVNAELPIWVKNGVT